MGKEVWRCIRGPRRPRSKDDHVVRSKGSSTLLHEGNLDVHLPTNEKNLLATHRKCGPNFYRAWFLTPNDIQTGKSVLWSIGEDHRRCVLSCRAVMRDVQAP